MRALTSRETLLWDAQGFKGMEVQQSTPQVRKLTGKIR
jgi:hypothetical protein